MKNLKFLLLAGLFSVMTLTSCEKEDNSTTTCGWYKDNTTIKGPNGGCYYINSNGNKSYVDRSYCPC